jgi:hypothetical protein
MVGIRRSKPATMLALPATATPLLRPRSRSSWLKPCQSGASNGVHAQISRKVRTVFRIVISVNQTLWREATAPPSMRLMSRHNRTMLSPSTLNWIPAKLNSSLVLEIAAGRYISAASSCGRDHRGEVLNYVVGRAHNGSARWQPIPNSDWTSRPCDL